MNTPTQIFHLNVLKINFDISLLPYYPEGFYKHVTKMKSYKMLVDVMYKALEKC